MRSAVDACAKLLQAVKSTPNLSIYSFENFFLCNIDRNTVPEKDQRVIWPGAVDSARMIRDRIFRKLDMHYLLDSK